MDYEEILEIQGQIERKQNNEYTINNGILYKKVGHEVLVVVPKMMLTDLIRKVHKRAHFASAKTVQHVEADYWFNNMQTKEDRVIRNCVACIMAERKSGKQESMLHSIYKGEKPLDTYHIDHHEHLASTKRTFYTFFQWWTLFRSIPGFTLLKLLTRRK